ncbi:MAG TPA: CoA transferase [Bdellovibrionota bacterium]|nr:CoA transferase [Bdellovibrionota bacterium]
MSGPLNSFRVLHLTANVPGPLAASKLAQAGARVTKVEPPQGDQLELGYPDWYRSMHEGQTILKLDLKQPETRKQMDELLIGCDLFLTTLRLPALKRLGLDWESVHRAHPKLSMFVIQGYPPPDENHAAHDLTCQAKAGTLTPPAMPRALLADFAAAERVVAQCLLLLIGARETGKGGYGYVALSQVAEDFGLPYRLGLTREDGVLGGAHDGYGLYRASDGWVALAALEFHFLSRFKEKLGLESTDREVLERVFPTRTAVEWENFGKEHDIPIAAVAT